MPSLGETLAALAARTAAGGLAQHSPRPLQPTTGFGLNRGALTMLTYVPKTLAPHAGLVVVLHGCTQTAQGYAEGAGWLELADRYGFMVLCPEQQRANNPNLCFNWFQAEDISRGAGEAASIADMIGWAIKAHGLDPSRVFITGLSAGGAMANVMLAAYPELFAAGAIIAGLPYGSAANVGEAFQAMSGQVRRSASDWAAKVRSASSHFGPWPRLSVWQGDQDHVVRSEVADVVAAQWAAVHDAIRAAPETSQSGRDVQAWRTADGETVVQLHRIQGMGHGAPLDCSGEDACGAAGAFLLDVGVSSSLELVRSWGLAGATAEASVGPAASPAAASPVAFRPPPARPAVGVGEVISKALRTAGLMK